jgi:hypothetical protein
MTNCLNCGAPFDVSKEKCSYCGTSYYDMSSLDINSDKPFMLKIKTTMGGNECYITQLVRVLPQMSIEMNTETTDVVDYKGTYILSCVSNRSMTTSLTFQAVPRKNGSLCEITMKEGLK